MPGIARSLASDKMGSADPALVRDLWQTGFLAQSLYMSFRRSTRPSTTGWIWSSPVWIPGSGWIEKGRTQSCFARTPSIASKIPKESVPKWSTLSGRTIDWTFRDLFEQYVVDLPQAAALFRIHYLGWRSGSPRFWSIK